MTNLTLFFNRELLLMVFKNRPYITLKYLLHRVVMHNILFSQLDLFFKLKILFQKFKNQKVSIKHIKKRHIFDC